ncbi:MAG: hypothetical protein AB8F94_12640 [Saprospiraceae bacterium]
MKKFIFFFSALVAISIFYSCKDEEPCATYEADIKSIVDKSCAYSGCHSGADAGMWVPADEADYTNYDGLLNSLDNGSFALEVIDSLTMPPFYVQDPHPKELSQSELDIIDCWIKDGYPKN